jgi:hypothetical protein
MAKYQPYRCPDCAEIFRHLHLLADLSDLPDRCPLCGAWVSDDEPPETVFVPQAPAVRSALSQSVDDVYRGMEEGSQFRTEQMAAMAGGSASDYAHTKITNLNDRQKEGDIAAPPAPPSPVTQMMAATPGATGYQQNAQAFAEANRYGIGAYAGERTRQATVSQHHQQLRAVVESGRVGTYKP